MGRLAIKQRDPRPCQMKRSPYYLYERFFCTVVASVKLPKDAMAGPGVQLEL